jgi:hypothetical protein
MYFAIRSLQKPATPYNGKYIEDLSGSRLLFSLFLFLTLGYVVAQGVIKRCRLSLLTNSALVIRVQMRGEGGSCEVSANEYSCARHVTGAQINFRDLPPYLTLCCSWC